MEKLADALLKDDVHDQVISDLEVLIDEEVADRKGVSGFAIKQGYKFVMKFKSDFVRDALESMFPEFVEALQPFYDEHGSPQGFDRFILANKPRVANGLLGVTDARARSTSKGAIRKAYEKLRPMAQSNVEQSLPRLAKLLQKYIDKKS